MKLKAPYRGTGKTFCVVEYFSNLLCMHLQPNKNKTAYHMVCAKTLVSETFTCPAPARWPRLRNCISSGRDAMHTYFILYVYVHTLPQFRSLRTPQHAEPFSSLLCAGAWPSKYIYVTHTSYI